MLEKPKRLKDRLKTRKKTVGPRDAGSLLGKTMVRGKYIMARTVVNNYHFKQNTCLAGSGAFNQTCQTANQLRNSTQSGDTTLPDTTNAPRNDRLPEKAKSSERWTKKPQGEVGPLSTTITLNKKSLQLRDFKNHDLLGTGAKRNAMCGG